MAKLNHELNSNISRREVGISFGCGNLEKRLPSHIIILVILTALELLTLKEIPESLYVIIYYQIPVFWNYLYQLQTHFLQDLLQDLQVY